MAVALWGIILASKYPIAKEFVDYAAVSSFRCLCFAIY